MYYNFTHSLHCIQTKTPIKMENLPLLWTSCWSWYGHGSKQPIVAYFLIKTPILEWYVVWCDLKIKYQEDIMCLKRIGLRAQDMIIILSLIVKIMRGVYMTIYWAQESSRLITNKRFIWAPTSIYEESGNNLPLDLLTILYQSHGLYLRRSGLVKKLTK